MLSVPLPSLQVVTPLPLLLLPVLSAFLRIPGEAEADGAEEGEAPAGEEGILCSWWRRGCCNFCCGGKEAMAPGLLCWRRRGTSSG